MSASKLSIQSTLEVGDEEVMRHLMQVYLYLLSLSSKQAARQGDTTNRPSLGSSTETLDPVDTGGDADKPIESENAPCSGRQDGLGLEPAAKAEQRDSRTD
jgi:hypothetical protein